MKKDVQDFKTDRGSAEGNDRSGPITGYPAAADSRMAVLVTVNGREFCRVREALAGCRGAALTRVFVMPARARYYKHTSCPEKWVPARSCGFRAQRRTSHVALAKCILA